MKERETLLHKAYMTSGIQLPFPWTPIAVYIKGQQIQVRIKKKQPSTEDISLQQELNIRKKINTIPTISTGYAS